jgi:STE24 endopeptidase
MSEERARRYHRLQLRLSVLAFALSVGYLFALLATGASARLAARLAEWTARPWLPVAAMALAVGAGWRILTLALTWLSGFWLPRRFGLLHQSFARWAWDTVKAGAIGGALALAGIEVVYTFMRWTPWWWLAAAAVFLVAAIVLTLVAPVWLVPLFYRLEPLGDGELRERLLRLGRRTGVPVLGVWVGDQSRKSRTAVLAHELAHHAHADIWRGLAVQGVVTLATFWLADRLLAAGATSLGLAGSADLAALPLLLLIALGAGVVALPLTNAWSRHVERQADDFAVRAVGSSGAFVAAMERLARLNLAEREPHPLKEALFYSHPAIGRRVARALALAARSPG